MYTFHARCTGGTGCPHTKSRIPTTNLQQFTIINEINIKTQIWFDVCITEIFKICVENQFFVTKYCMHFVNSQRLICS